MGAICFCYAKKYMEILENKRVEQFSLPGAITMLEGFTMKQNRPEPFGRLRDIDMPTDIVKGESVLSQSDRSDFYLPLMMVSGRKKDFLQEVKGLSKGLTLGQKERLLSEAAKIFQKIN